MRQISYPGSFALLFVWSLGIGLLSSSLLAEAQESAKPKAVIELFTSQGCSSCPPADKLLGKLAKRDDVIALTLPVDYWDYLGWKDTLAKPQYSKRQRSYAQARGDRQVYTPQVVINGRTHAVGSRKGAVNAAIRKVTKQLSNSFVAIKISVKDDKIIVDLGEAPRGLKRHKGTLWMATITNSVPVKIKRGENHGRNITYSNVVKSLKPIGEWNGSNQKLVFNKKDFMGKGADGCTVFLQQGKSGQIIGAAELKSWL
ncbi:MAG: DUF1223 domain-containing protein [Methyloligellaceae bacterium]